MIYNNDEKDKLPLHIKIKDDIFKKIESGYYEVGEIIPTEMELAEFYKVSRPTVRQAISSLVAEGYLERKKRKGTIVCKKKINQEFTYKIESFESEMLRKGLLPKTKVLSFKCDIANLEVSNALEIDEGSNIYKLTRLRYIENEPVVIVTTYLSSEMFPSFSEVDFEKNSLYKVMLDLGSPVISIKRKLEVIKSDETTSDLLNIKENDPIFYFHSYGYTNNNVPVEYSISKYRGDMNSFIFNISNTNYTT